jgi:hypothetical protein
MKAPSWMVITGPHFDGDQAYCTVRVRLWHPGFYFWLLREWWHG